MESESSAGRGAACVAPGASKFRQSRSARLILPLLAYKAFMLWLVLASARLLPGAFRLEGYQANFRWPEDKKPTLAERFVTWDEEHYLYLSQHGYEAGSPSAAFYPLWPLLIWLGARLAPHQNLIGALVLSNALSLASWLFFHRLVALEHGDELADWATVFLVAFPGSLFLQFAYSESLFLFLILAFFWGMARERSLWIAVVGFLLPMTRAVGVFCAVPLLLHHWLHRKGSKDYALAAAIGAGWCAYLLLMYLTTDNPLEGFVAQRYYAAGASVARLFDPIGFIQSVFVPLQLHGSVDSAIDRFFFVCFVAALFPLYRFSKVCFACAVAVGLIPAVTNSFMSYTRFLAVVFPLFIIAAQCFSEPRRTHRRWFVLASLFALQVLFLLRHMNFLWAG